MGKGCLLVPKELFIKVSGKIIYNMAKERRFGLMGLNIKDNIEME